MDKEKTINTISEEVIHCQIKTDNASSKDTHQAGIVYEIFQHDDGLVKLHLDYLSNAQASQIMELVKSWNEQKSDECDCTGKFKEGDWIFNDVAQYHYPCLVVRVTEKSYCLMNRNGTFWEFKIVIDKSYRMWTTDDMYRGGVYTTEDGKIFSFSYLSCGSVYYYFIYDGKTFKYNNSAEHISCKGIIPATREQCELLYSAKEKADKETSKSNSYEPKFPIGTWIISNKHIPCIVKYINDGMYHCVYYNELNVEQQFDYPCDKLDKEYHIWSLDDAVDGDVLTIHNATNTTASNVVFIYKQISKVVKYQTSILSHCSMNNYTLCLTNRIHVDCGNITPANGTEKDNLFNALKKNGYGWNNSKCCIFEQQSHKHKFNTGEWIAKNDSLDAPHFVILTSDSEYHTQYVHKGKWRNFTCPVKELEDNYHKWTLEDAKCGDILYAENVVFEYTRHDETQTYFRTAYNIKKNKFHLEPVWNDFVVPATPYQIEKLQTMELKLIKNKKVNKRLKFETVYCKSSIDGRGVIEILEQHGGKNKNKYKGYNDNKITSDGYAQNIDTIYYINSNNEIEKVSMNNNIALWNTITTLYTEVKPIVTENNDYTPTRVVIGETYYYVEMIHGYANVKQAVEAGYPRDKKRFKNHNYFIDANEAITKAKMINDIIATQIEQIIKEG